MNRNIIYILFLLPIFGCSSSSDVELVEEEQPSHELSVVEETNLWIYQYMNHHYLWRDDIPDSTICDFTKVPVSFYKSLLSQKDRFSYVEFSTRTITNYGFAYQIVRDYQGTDYWAVLYTISPEAKSQLKRGMILYPQVLGADIATFTIVDAEQDCLTKRSVTLHTYPQTRATSSSTVYLDSIYTVEDLKVGYLCYLQYLEARDFYPSFNKFADAQVDELILDLRYNPGGYEKTCKTLCNAIVDESAYNNIFVKHSYNSIVAAENKVKYGDEYTYVYYDKPKDTHESNVLGEVCPSLNLKRIFILTSEHSASCSELTIISLRPFMDVIVIGENTTGKGVGMQPTNIPNFNYTLVPITFRFYNALDETVPNSGLNPDVYVPDGYLTSKKQLGDIEEPLLRTAMELIIGKDDFDSTKVSYASAMGTSTLFNLTPIGEPSFVIEYKQNSNYYEN